MRKLALLVMLFLIVVLAVPTFAAQNGGPGLSKHDRDPVSYTHLDVYKRQVWGHATIQGNTITGTANAITCLLYTSRCV